MDPTGHRNSGIFSRPAVQLGLHPPYRKVSRVRMRPPHGASIAAIHRGLQAKAEGTLPGVPRPS
jgi:hypothetical protein